MAGSILRLLRSRAGVHECLGWRAAHGRSLSRHTGRDEPRMSTARLPFVWDYDLAEGDFEALLAGRKTIGRLDRNWAAVRVLEYAPYAEIRRLLSLRSLVDGWPS